MCRTSLVVIEKSRISPVVIAVEIVIPLSLSGPVEHVPNACDHTHTLCRAFPT